MVTDYTTHHQTLFLAQEIDLKACTPGTQTQNPPAGPWIEPGPSDRLFWSGAHCDSVTLATEADSLVYVWQKVI